MSQVYYKIPEIALRYGKSVRSIYSMLEAGEIRAVKIGRSTRISASELDRYETALAPFQSVSR